MKIIIKIVIFIFVLVLNLNYIYAFDEYYYVNNNEIVFDKQQYDNLIGLGFSKNELKYLNIEEFYYYNKFEPNIDAMGEKYFKYVYIYDANEYENNIKKMLSVERIEITKEKYENAKQEEGDYFGLQTVSLIGETIWNSYYETAYKKLSISVGNAIGGGETLITAYLEWKIPPAVRNYDIFAIRTSNKIIVENTKFASASARYKTTDPMCDRHVDYTLSVKYGSTDLNWNKDKKDLLTGRYSGVGITFNPLHSNIIGCFHSELATPIWLKPILSSRIGITTKSLFSGSSETAYITYQHSISQLNLNNIRYTYSFFPGGLGNVISFNNGYNQYYDGMSGIGINYLSR
jgi:hypothetical protein